MTINLQSEADLLPQRNPDIPRPIDNTALSTYKTCPREYLYSMVYNRRSKGRKPPLVFGTTWHAIKAEHYLTGGDTAAVERAAIMSWEDHGVEGDHRTVVRAIRSYYAWLKEYGGSFEEEQRLYGTTVGWPDSPFIEKTVEIWWPGAPHPYVGKLDRIFNFNGLFYVEDHKHSSQLGDNYFYQWDPSDQMMGYAVLAQELTGLPIAGVRIDAFGCLKTQDKFARKTITYDPARLREWKAAYGHWVEKLAASYRRLALESPDRPAVEDAAFPPNFNACSRKYGSCTYVGGGPDRSGVCTFASTNNLRARILEQEYEVNAWNPMNPDGDED